MLLNVVEIEKYYGTRNNLKKALDRVSFSVNSGDFVSIMGAMSLCFAFLSDHMDPGNVNGLISRYILPIRPDRTYARQLRFQSPASFSYRFV